MEHHFVEPVVVPLDPHGETMDPPAGQPPTGPGEPAPDVIPGGAPEVPEPDADPDPDLDPDVPTDPVPG